MLIKYVPYDWTNLGPPDGLNGNTKSICTLLIWNGSPLPINGGNSSVTLTINSGLPDYNRIVGVNYQVTLRLGGKNG